MENSELTIKAGYKQTDVGIIPEDWDIKLLGEIGTFKKGKGIKKDSVIAYGLPCIRYGEIYTYHNDYIKQFNSHISRNTAKESQRLKQGDLLFAGSGETAEEIGKCIAYLDDKEAYAGGDIIILSPIECNSLYLGFLMNHKIIVKQKSQMGQGDAVVHIYSSSLSNVKVPLPPLPEQQAIAEVLSDVDALVTSLEGLITKKRNIKQGAMQLLLTGKKRLPGFSGDWETKTLGEIGECIIGLTYSPENVRESGLLVLRSSNVQNNCLAYNDNVFVNIEVPERIRTKEGDILICVRNGSRDLIGKSAIIDKKAAGLTFGAFMSVFRTKYFDYVFHLFQSNILKRQIRDNLGATINQITNKDLGAFEIPFPPVLEQKAIAQILSEIDAEIEALETRQAKYKAVKQGMMQELLTGKTRLINK